MKVPYTTAVIILIVCIIASSVQAQIGITDAKIQVSGEIVDKEDGAPIPYASIANLSKGLMTVSDEQGRFSISISINDSLEFSSLGYNKHVITLSDTLNSDEFNVNIELSRKVYELESVNVYAYKDEESFKKAILEMELPEKEDPEPIHIPGAYYGPKKPASATGPISFLSQKFGKKARFEKKLQQIREDYNYNKVVNEKFNKELVAEVTGLTDKVLDKFILFCELEDDFIVKSNEYEILVAIDECYNEFTEKGLAEN